jgi:hypothetical protein
VGRSCDGIISVTLSGSVSRYKNGDDYDGEFVDDQRTGIGLCKFA